jgi:ADP-heptose:LPS heptosyltransferase
MSNHGAASDSPSVLLVRLDAIGDALTLVPVIAALRRYDLRIGAVLRPVNALVFSQRALDRVHVAEHAVSALVPEIRALRYGTALIPTEKPEGYRLPYRARIPRRIGFENGWGKPLKTLWIRRMCTRTLFRTAGLDPRAPHECEVVFALARTVVRDFEPPRDPRVLRPFVIDEEPQPDARIVFQVTDKWQRLGASLDDVADLVRRIRSKRRLRCIAAASESEYARRLAERADIDVETFDTLPAWKSAIAAARAAVAPDSGAVHVAGMVGTPVVACFASSDFALQSRRWAPWAAPHRVVRMDGAWTVVAADALDDLLTDSPQFSYTG